MKKLIAAVGLALAMAGNAHAVSVLGDLIPYSNYSATFTKTMDVGELASFTIQVVASTATQPTPVMADMSRIDTSLDTIYSTQTYGLGQAFFLTGTAPTGLSIGPTYYFIPRSDTLYAAATTPANAVAGTAIDITATSGSTSIWVNPIAFAMGVTAGITWDGSNDGTNFSSVGSSVTLTTIGSGTQLRDFGTYGYKWLRMSVTGVQWGVMKLRLYINGRRAD